MKVFDLEFKLEIGAVADVDVSPQGEFASIQGSPSEQVLMIDDRRIALPSDWTPPDYAFVRWLHDGRLLVSNSSFARPELRRAWILNVNRDVQIDADFDVGSAVVDIIPLWKMIAVAHHPTSARQHGHLVEPAQRSGVAFYDLQGRLLMGLNHELQMHGLSIDNVRCATRISKTELILIPERLFVNGQELRNPALVFDTASRRLESFSLPIGGSEAVCWSGRWLHLASPFGFEDQIVTVDLVSRSSRPRGEFAGIFRGLDGGAFIAQFAPSHYAVVEPGEPEIRAADPPSGWGPSALL